MIQIMVADDVVPRPRGGTLVRATPPATEGAR